MEIIIFCFSNCREYYVALRSSAKPPRSDERNNVCLHVCFAREFNMLFSKTFHFGKTFFEVLKYRVLLLKCGKVISIAINISLTKAEKLNCGSNYSKSVL